MRAFTIWAAGLCLAVACAIGLAEDTIRGTPFGAGRVTGALVDIAEEHDTDDFVAPLAVGERLSVTVVGKGGLVPRISVIDPDGLTRAADVSSGRSGRRLRVSRHPIDKTGPWAVRISGGETQGRYTATFRVDPPPREKARKLVVGDHGPREVVHPFDAVEGSSLDLSARWSSEGAPIAAVRILTPSGDELPGLPGALNAHRRRARLRRLALTGGTGTYTLVLRFADGAARYSYSLRVDPRRARPRGRTKLAPEEAFLLPRGVPFEGREGTRVRLRGAGFPATPPPEVFFDDTAGTVASVSPSGLLLEVLPPPGATGSVVEVAVVGADGQATCRSDYFRYTEPIEPPPPPPPVEIASLEPTSVTLDAGESQDFVVRLNRPAEFGGAVVRIVTTGGIGSAPDPIVVQRDADTATFVLQATDAAASGEVRATLVRTLSASVTVVRDDAEDPDDPPAEIDLSGWTLRQTGASASFRFPTGTIVTDGGYLVIARDATRAAFESHWNVELGDDVVYIDSEDSLPRINGSEDYVLENAAGTAVDGPTIAMASGGGRNLQRLLPVGAAGETDAWSDTQASVMTATPGAGQGVATSPTGVYISEISDATGSGNFVFEFVELHFDGEPE